MPASPKSASFEYVLTRADESFLWRRDGYPWERNVWNFHPEVEIHLITNASGIQMVGDHIGEFKPGNLCVVGSNLPHDWVTPVKPGEFIEGRDIVIQFHPDRFAGASALLPELSSMSEFLSRAQRGLLFHGKSRDGAETLILEMEHQSGAERLGTFLSLLALFQATDEWTYLSSQAYSPDLEHGSLDALQRALSHIFANLSEEIRLPELAEKAGMSESAFSRFFKKNSGHSFTDHVNQLRIWKASQLLAETDMPVTDVCFEVGYRNLSNFNRTFLRHHGITPSKYRSLSVLRRTTPLPGTVV